VTMDAVAIDPEQLRKLVRRDLVVTATGSLIAIWTYSLVAAAAFGSVSELTAGRVEVAVAVLVSAFCVWWWASGPPGMMRDRLHPSSAGYQIWADALKPIFTELLGPPAAEDHAPPPTGDPSAAR